MEEDKEDSFEIAAKSTHETVKVSRFTMLAYLGTMFLSMINLLFAYSNRVQFLERSAEIENVTYDAKDIPEEKEKRTLEVVSDKISSYIRSNTNFGINSTVFFLAALFFFGNRRQIKEAKKQFFSFHDNSPIYCVEQDNDEIIVSGNYEYANTGFGLIWKFEGSKIAQVNLFECDEDKVLFVYGIKEVFGKVNYAAEVSIERSLQDSLAATFRIEGYDRSQAVLIEIARAILTLANDYNAKKIILGEKDSELNTFTVLDEISVKAYSILMAKIAKAETSILR